MSKKNARKRGKNGARGKNLPPIGKRFTSEYQPENNGRKKKLENVIKSIPRDAQDKIYEALYTALAQSDRQAAMNLLKEYEGKLGEYGFVLQIAVNALAGKQGMQALNSILDRLFGRPKQQLDTNITSDGSVVGINVIVKDFSKGGGNDKNKPEEAKSTQEGSRK